MKVQQIMERAGIDSTGRAIAYIEDALEELAMRSETHITVERQNLNKDQRYYDIPFDSVKIIDIRCKNQNNSEDDYHSIPRTIHKPTKGDADGI